MIVYLNISRAADSKALLKASFHRISQSEVKLEKPFKEITGKPVEFVTKVVEELTDKGEPIRFYHCDPEVPKNVQALLFKSLMAYYRVTLPKHCSVVRICRDPEKKNSINAVWYESEESASLGLEPLVYSGNPVTVAAKVIEGLDGGYRNQAKLEFEEGVSQEVQDLFSQVISIYNKSVEPKAKV